MVVYFFIPLKRNALSPENPFALIRYFKPLIENRVFYRKIDYNKRIRFILTLINLSL